MRPVIKKISACEILDSRGTPTLQATVVLEDGTAGIASVPSGASRGKYEAFEKRDGDPTRYNGKGVLSAVAAVEKQIAPTLIGTNAADQARVDRLLLSLDGTPNKHRLGANSTLAVSLAAAHAAANYYRVPLFRHIGGIFAQKLPVPMFNVLGGGAHASNNVDVQEFMILPHGAPCFAEALRWGTEIYHALGKLLRARGLQSTVGDEGAFAPDLACPADALDLLCEAIEAAGYRTSEVGIAIDAAAGEWQTENGYLLPKSGQHLTTAQLVTEWESLLARYPIRSIEDPFAEEDAKGWQALGTHCGKDLMLVGDDLFVTSSSRLQKGIKEGLGNAILIKPNQIGTLSETFQVVRLAQKSGYRVILSHRSGETEDTSIADIAVALGADFIKAGAPCRSERLAKYNRLLRIAAHCGDVKSSAKEA